MATRVFPMWPSDERMVNLKDVLRIVGDNSWEWRISYLVGTGPLPLGMSWDEFDEKIEEAPCVLDWPGLVELADGLVQVMNGEIRAICAGAEVARVEAFDSSEWTISLRAVEVGDLDDRIARLLQGGT